MLLCSMLEINDVVLYCIVLYDLSVLSMSVMGFQKKKFGWRWVGGVSSIQVYFGFVEFVQLCKATKPAGVKHYSF